MRLEGQSKLGYYPTPPEMVELIKNYLKFPKNRFYALDPCCGEGIALNLLINGTKAKTYGVELDKYRAIQARDKVDQVINDAIENVVITEGNFSLLFLNPPYDWNENRERKEGIFLAETSKYLMPEGVLVFIIPTSQIDHVWDVLTTNYENIINLDFPMGYKEAYNQTAIFATKKRYPCWDRIQPFKYNGVLGDELTFNYPVPSAKGQIATFSSTTYNIEESFSDDIWEEFTRIVKESQVSSAAPLLPLREGHISLLLACGYLDGQISGHVAKGTVTEEILTESEGERIKEKTYLKACVKVLDHEGNIKTLS